MTTPSEQMPERITVYITRNGQKQWHEGEPDRTVSAFSLTEGRYLHNPYGEDGVVVSKDDLRVKAMAEIAASHRKLIKAVLADRRAHWLHSLATQQLEEMDDGR